MSRRTLICLTIALGFALLCGAMAQALPAGAAFSLPLTGEKVIPPAGMTIGLELFRPLPDGTLSGPIATWDTGQPTRPTVLDCMAVRISVFPAANSINAVKVSADKYGRELAAKARSKREGKEAERAQYTKPDVGWSRFENPPLRVGFLPLDATVWSKDENNKYQIAQRAEERKTFGQGLAVVKASPASWQGIPPANLTDEDLVRGYMKGWEYLGSEDMDPAYLASKMAKAAMQQQLAQATPQAPASGAQPQDAAKEQSKAEAEPEEEPTPTKAQKPQRRQQERTVTLKLSNTSRNLNPIIFNLTTTVVEGDTLVFIKAGKGIATAKITSVKGSVICARMLTGRDRNVSKVEVGVIVNDEEGDPDAK